LLQFEDHQTSADGLGQASSQKVQFNINKDATKGTIFVNEHNQGIVKATLSSNHRFTHGWAVFNPEGSSTDPVPGTKSNPHDIDRCVAVSAPLTGDKEMTFSVIRVGGLVGSVTLTFFVQYRAVA
jgi:hypothetical protein